MKTAPIKQTLSKDDRKALYIHRIRTERDVEIWQVDGKYIRDNVDVDFPNLGQPFAYPFIPKNEFWLDTEQDPDEQDFFIAHLFSEYDHMKDGMSYETALHEANIVEMQLRLKATNAPKKLDAKYLFKVNIGELPISVFVVNGRYVREHFHLCYTEGGNDKAYDWMPAQQIWYDSALIETEYPAILLHEFSERCFMDLDGDDYKQAHKKANVIEWAYRQATLKKK
jgi:hypothetical protein